MTDGAQGSDIKAGGRRMVYVFMRMAIDVAVGNMTMGRMALGRVVVRMIMNYGRNVRVVVVVMIMRRMVMV